jgi:large subunit ribosomal protein L10
LAISKEQKKEVLAQYVNLANRSQAMIVTEYRGLTMKQIDDLRSRVRENGGEFHIVKNTLGKLAIEQEGMPLPAGLLEGSTAICFAFTDAAAMAKTMTDFARTSEFLKIKGGYLEKQAISAEEVRSLAELPPLPVIRAQLLGTILSPASTLARTLAEPARQVAAVLQAFSDRENAPASA